MPTKAELIEAVREFIERDVMDATEGRVNFHARVAVNVLRMVERELELGGEQAAAHRQGLEELGVADERALAEAIKDGTLDDRAGEVRAFVTETVRAKLDVANPDYR
ncbi:MAG: hypothetical protein QOF60_1306 [Actinomycetota bacterium]|jgi:hypothetical protein|nr:hypothetical protein [Actinomycetota bacterium]